jgi:arylsulfatase A-like enzyme
MNRLLTLTMILAGLSAGGSITGAEAPRPPHVIVILADDLGWGDVSCQGGVVPTPAIDRLAREGRRFTSGYCSASTCTPTRYSLLTGEYAFRRPGTGIAPPGAAAIIQPGTPTLPEALRAAGYATAVVGKWHLGLGEPGKGPDWNGRLVPGPLEIGFDHCFLLPTTNDRVPQVFVAGDRVANLDPADPLWVGMTKPSTDHVNGIDHRDRLTMDWSHGHNGTIHNGIGRIGFYTGGERARFRDQDLADTWVTESLRWIDRRRAADTDQPFFLLFASHDIHVPRVPHERFAGASGLGPRGDCIMQLDWCVGELIAALERLGIADETLVIVCSDNGPVLDDGYKDEAVEKLGDHRPAGPFRGGKYDVYEGGTRTPFIAWWPNGIVPAVCDEIVCTIDLPRTLATLAGRPPAEELFPDSEDLLGVLLGKPGALGRATLVQQDNGRSGRFGYRNGRWKLVRQPGKKQPPKQADRPDSAALPRDALYDLEADPGETIDVSDRFPDVARRLARELDAAVRRPRAQDDAAPARDAAATRSPAGPVVQPATNKPPLRMLFIGNSYTFANDLPGMLTKLSAAGRQRRIISVVEAPGGCTFERHLADGRATARIDAGRWDYVVLQEQSQLPVVDPSRTIECGGRLDRAVRAAGGRTLFFQTWARAAQPEMQDGLTATYAALARNAAPAADGSPGGLVVPVGNAWRAALSLVPPPVLHVADGSHPTPAGTYLAACVFYGVIHGASPVGLSGRFAGLDDATARRLQEVAWASVPSAEPAATAR